MSSVNTSVLKGLLRTARKPYYEALAALVKDGFNLVLKIRAEKEGGIPWNQCH